MSSAAPHTPSIVVGATAASEARVRTAALVFQRWATENGLATGVPPGLLEGLRSYALEPEIKRIDFCGTFCLKSQSRQPTVRVYEFAFLAPQDLCQSITVQWVRKRDNDLHMLDAQSGRLTSTLGHWTVGSRHESSHFSHLPRVKDARELLREHWLAPHRWLDEGRAVLVRPSPTDTTLATMPTHRNGVALCPLARKALVEGMTLLLVVGDLVRVELPGGTIFFAAMMFRENSLETNPPSASATVAVTGGRGTVLSFVICEKASRGHYSAGTSLGFVDGMYDWQITDIYDYIPGTWAQA